MELRLAVFTVETYLLTPEELAPELARLGFDGVEWRITTLPESIPDNRNYWNGNVCTFDITDLENQAPRLQALSDQHGLALPSLGTYLDCADLASIEACCRAAKSLGIPMFRVGLPRFDHTVPYEAGFAAAVEAWEPVVDLARKYQIKVLAEMHHGALIPSASAAARFLRHWSPEEVGGIYDPGNMVHEGWEHPDLAIGTMGPYLAHVHIKNARWVLAGEDHGRAKWKGEMCRLREGQVCWPEVFAALHRAGYDGWFSTEDFGQGDTIEKLTDNLAALREWAAAIG